MCSMVHLNEEDQPRNRNFYIDRAREINELVGYINYLENSISEIMQTNDTARDYISDEVGQGNFFNRLQDAKDRLREAKHSMDLHREDRERIEGRYYDDEGFAENEEKRFDIQKRDLRADDQVRLRFIELKDIVEEFIKKLDNHENNIKAYLEGSSKYAYCDELVDVQGLVFQLGDYCYDCYSGMKYKNEKVNDFLKELSIYVSKAKSGISMLDTIASDLKTYNPELVGEPVAEEEKVERKDFTKMAIDLVRQKCTLEQAKAFEEELDKNGQLSEQARKQTQTKFMFSTQDERVDLSHNVARNFLEFGRDGESVIKREISWNSRNTKITEEDINKLCEEVSGQLMQCASRNVPTIKQAIISLKQQTKEY